MILSSPSSFYRQDLTLPQGDCSTTRPKIHLHKQSYPNSSLQFCGGVLFCCFVLSCLACFLSFIFQKILYKQNPLCISGKKKHIGYYISQNLLEKWNSLHRFKRKVWLSTQLGSFQGCPLLNLQDKPTGTVSHPKSPSRIFSPSTKLSTVSDFCLQLSR